MLSDTIFSKKRSVAAFFSDMGPRLQHYRRIPILLCLVVLLLFLGTRVYRAAGDDSPADNKGSVPAAARVAPEWQTFLLLGLDQRSLETPRSDTVIVVNWDRANDRANVLSLPRDLWVEIPGYGWDKLGSAYTLGSGSDGPGGAALVKDTLKANLGIEITHYAAVTLEGFQSAVDKVGGVWIDVPFPLLDNEFPAEDYKYRRLYVPPGLQRMDGAGALAYARSRHADGDFGRSERQQQVLQALRERIITIHSAPKLPGLVRDLSQHVQTDLSIPETIGMAPDALNLKSENIRTESVDFRFLAPAQTGSGMSILEPVDGDWQRLRRQVKQRLEWEQK